MAVNNPTWKALCADIIRNSTDLDQPAYITIFTRDLDGSVTEKVCMPVARFSPFADGDTGAIIVESKE
tara:strand:- start:177 stop:380 length:204 start_codon:yes stop_codon:yes gene_type:complete